MDSSWADYSLYKIDEEEEEEEELEFGVRDISYSVVSYQAGKKSKEKQHHDTFDDWNNKNVDEGSGDLTVPSVYPRRCESSQRTVFPENVERLNFVLHPRLHHDSLTSCTSSPGQESPTYFQRSKKQMLDISSSNSAFVNKGLALGQRKNVHFVNSALSKGDSDFEIHIESKTVDEILMDIATGKWPSKSIVYDDETENTRKLELRPCSNVNCVRETERFRKKQQDVMLQTEDMDNECDDYDDDADDESDNVLFEDGDLPSYHSLLSLWNVQNKYTWEENVFKNGYPSNESEFLEAWRACRWNPEAYGITIKPQQELPDRDELRRIARTKTTTNLKTVIKQELMFKTNSRNPINLPRLYSGNLRKGTIPPQERENMRARYHELRDLYPHLPPLRPVDFVKNPNIVRVRLKQAEEWHHLVSVTNRPQPVLKRQVSKIGDLYNNNKNPDNTENKSLHALNDMPRYAGATASFTQKMKNVIKTNMTNF